MATHSKAVASQALRIRGSRLWRTVPALGVGALAVALLVSIIGHQRQSPPPTGRIWTRGQFFGVNAPVLRDYATPRGAAALNSLASSMAAAGIRWARIVFDQSVEEKLPGVIDWSIPDRVVAALADHGVRSQALFIGTPGWVADTEDWQRCRARSAPHDVQDWARFVGAAVARYGRRGSFWRRHPGLPPLPIETWEIGNEENTHVFWCPEADPEAYAELYARSRSTALEADPRALVIVGGLAPAFDGAGPGDLTVSSFLRRMVEADPSLPGEIPGVATHPYAETADGVLNAIVRYRKAMRQARLGETPMFVNEFGWYTRGRPGPLLASQQARAERIHEVVVAALRSDCGVVALGVHSWVTYQANPLDSEDWYGLADPITGLANQSGRAYAEAIKAVRSGHASSSEPDAAVLCG
jgi:hypothetical protein